MTDPFSPIKAFNNQLDLTQAFARNRTQILQFLDHVVANPATYGVPVDNRPRLGPLREHIHALQLNGNGFRQPAPQQQVLRQVRGQTKEVAPTDPIPWDTNNKSERFFAIFDLLGIFLSLLGPAPNDATSKNFFLPLVVVYAKWCLTLSGIDLHGQALRPTVAQITWASLGQGEPRHFFISASLAGFAHQPPWPTKSKQARWNYLTSSVPQVLHDFPGFHDSPLRRPGTDGQVGTRFGNCGETYPFLYVLSDQALRDNCFGISFHIATAGAKNSYNGTHYWNDRSFKVPCLNCEELITRYGGNIAHFTRDGCARPTPLTSVEPRTTKSIALPPPATTIASTAPTDPPPGWTKDKADLLEDYYWVDKPGALQSALKKTYGLENAKPVWARDSKAGEIMYIFEALSGREKNYYVWNGVENSVFRFEQKELKDIKKAITDHGGERGYLGQLKVAEVPTKNSFVSQPASRLGRRISGDTERVFVV